jgi:peptidoglycan hydrolase-like protein with peptidoglycan-binding domain
MAKGNLNKIVAGTLALVGAYFVYRYFKKPKGAESIFSPTGTTTSTTTTTSSPSGFPLKKGSKGSLVSSVQQWILKIDKTLLPKYGADGDFGSETEAAVQKLLGKKTIDGNSDIDRLIYLYNQKTFPLLVGVPNQATPPFLSIK